MIVPDRQVDSPLMNTNIALVGADLLATRIDKLNNVVVDPVRLMDQARKGYNKDDDIEEDENDRFISSRKGKLRPRFETGLDTNDWAEEVRPNSIVLSRPKRSRDSDLDEKREMSHKHHKHHKHSKDSKRDQSESEVKKIKEDKEDSETKRSRRDATRYRPKGSYLPVSEFSMGSRKPIRSKHHPIEGEHEKQKSDVTKGRPERGSEEELDETPEHSKVQKKSKGSGAHQHLKKVRVLSRQKRCGGRRDDDDDGDANRARRTRRARRRAARRARKRAQKAAQSSTTTVTRRVIQDGQVVSQDGTTQTACAQQQVAPQPIILQQPAPVVQNVVPGQQIVQPAQPIVQSAAPVQPIVQAPGAPVQPIVQAAPAPVPAVAAQGSLQGSVQQGASVEGTMKISA